MFAGCVPADDVAPPDDPGLLGEWLRAGHYLDWTTEPEVVVGENGAPRRVYVNDVLFDGFAAKRFAVGSAAVREMYGEDDTLRGLSFMEKRAVDAQAMWFFYESFDITDDDFAVAAIEPNRCTSCHVNGTDLVQSSATLFR